MTRARLPLALSLLAFAAVFGVHGYVSMFPPVDPALARWAAQEPGFGERFSGYFSTGALWLGYSYAVSAWFGVYCLTRRLIEPAPLFRVAGGLTVSGALAGAACFLTGCCGSPMLGVWISLLGAGAAAYLGPAAALFTTLAIAFAWRRLFHNNCACVREFV